MNTTIFIILFLSLFAHQILKKYVSTEFLQYRGLVAFLLLLIFGICNPYFLNNALSIPYYASLIATIFLFIRERRLVISKK